MTPVEVAKKYLGAKEQPGNVFDETTAIGKALKKAGHNNGEPWCCYFQEAVFCEAKPEIEQKLRRLFSPNCVMTFFNFLSAGYRISNYPVEGSLVLFQSCKDGIQSTKGHAGIVSHVISKTQFKSIEGNTSDGGSREGTTVAEQTRDILLKESGLNVLGFVLI